MICDTKKMKKLLRTMMKYPNATANELAKLSGIGYVTVKNYLMELYKVGVVGYTKIGSLRKWFVKDTKKVLKFFTD